MTNDVAIMRVLLGSRWIVWLLMLSIADAPKRQEKEGAKLLRYEPEKSGCSGK